MNAPFQPATGSAGDKPPLLVLIAAPRGFCAGVDRAIEIVERALERYGAPVYVRHEIVHNRYVVDQLKAKGAVFVEELDEVPADVPVVFSAHGVPKSVPAEAERRGLTYVDATCPLVSKVHRQAERQIEAGRHILFIGHKGHPEVIGTFGQVPEGPKAEDICYATSNRQAAVKTIAPQCQLVLVIGAPNSSNSLRLVEVAQRCGARGMLIQRASEMQADWLEGVEVLGLTAGASAPEELIQEVIEQLSAWREVTVEQVVTAEEKMVFKLPRQLVD